MTLASLFSWTSLPIWYKMKEITMMANQKWFQDLIYFILTFIINGLVVKYRINGGENGYNTRYDFF